MNRTRRARIVAALALFALCVVLLHGMLPAVAWAGLIAVGTWPLHRRLGLGRGSGPAARTASAALLTAVAALLLLLPLGWLLWRGALELPALVHVWTASRDTGLPAPEWLASVPHIGPWLARRWNEELAAPGALDAVVHGFMQHLGLHSGRALLAHVGRHAMTVFFCVLVLFFLYRDGDALAAEIEVVAGRVFGPAGVRTLHAAVSAMRGTVNGLVLVGLALAAVMAVAYAVADLPHPALAGLATGLLGMVPFGAVVVVAGAVLWLFTEGSGQAAIALGVFGAVLIFVTDHFVRPLFISGTSRLPMVLALLGIVAGLETLGVLGIFLGPTLLAVATAVWREVVLESTRETGVPTVPAASVVPTAPAVPTVPGASVAQPE